MVTRQAPKAVHVSRNPSTRAKNYSSMMAVNNPSSLATPPPCPPEMTSSVVRKTNVARHLTSPSPPEIRSRFSPSSRLFPTASHAERTSTLRPGYEALGGDLVLGSRVVACWNNATEDFGLQMSDMPSRCGTMISGPNAYPKTNSGVP